MNRKYFLLYCCFLLIIILVVVFLPDCNVSELTLDNVINDTGYHFLPENAVNGTWEETLPVFLKNGQYRFGVNLNERYKIKLPYASGDLDGDGDEDFAVTYLNYGGGTAQWTEMTVIINDNGKPVQYDNSLVGDRVGVTNMRIQDGDIFMTVIDYRWAYEYQYTFQMVDEELVKTLISEELIGADRIQEY